MVELLSFVLVLWQPHVDFGLKLGGADLMSIPGLYRFVQVFLSFSCIHSLVEMILIIIVIHQDLEISLTFMFGSNFHLLIRLIVSGANQGSSCEHVSLA